MAPAPNSEALGAPPAAGLTGPPSSRALPAPRGRNAELSEGVGWRPSFHDAGGGLGGGGALERAAGQAPSRAPREEFPAWD